MPTLAAVLARFRDARIIVELKLNNAALADAALDVVRRADAVERVCFGAFGRRVLRAVRTAEPASGDERGARGSPLGAVSIVVRMARIVVRPTRASRYPNGRAAHAWCPAGSLTLRTRPPSASRCGRSTPKTTPAACSAWASTPSSPTALTRSSPSSIRRTSWTHSSSSRHLLAAACRSMVAHAPSDV